MQDSIIDRILGAVYKPPLEDGSLNLYKFYHQLRRLDFLGSQGNTINFLPIFAVKESEGNHLGDWMDTIGSVPYVWEHYQSEFLEDTAFYTDKINLQGYVWYNHSNMPQCFDILGFEGYLQGPEGVLFKDSIYTFKVSNYENATRFYWDLPKSVVFADSSKWGEEVHLKFLADFNEGDSISVRPANRCHLGKSQYFTVKEFDGVTSYFAGTSVYFKNGILHINLLKPQLTEYHIFNSSGQLIKMGFIDSASNQILMNTGFGLYYVRIIQDGKSSIKKFVVN